MVPGFSRADGPLGLAAATIYVPTRRSARALAAVAGAAPRRRHRCCCPASCRSARSTTTELLFDDGGLEDALSPDLPAAIGDIAAA